MTPKSRGHPSQSPTREYGTARRLSREERPTGRLRVYRGKWQPNGRFWTLGRNCRGD